MRKIVRAMLGSAEPAAGALVDAAPALAVRAVFHRFWPDARPFRGWLCLGLVLVALSPLVSSAEIYLFKVVVDDVLTPRNFQAFPAVAAAYVGLTILSGSLSFASQYLAVWNGEHFLLRLRNRVFAHLHTLSPDFFDRRRLGDTLSRLTGDIAAIESLVLSGVAQTISSLLQIVVFTGVLFVLDWRLALVAMLAVPLFWTVARVFSRRIKAASREARQRSGSLATVAEESLGNTTLIQAYGREKAEEERFAAQGRAGVAAVLRAARVGAGFGPLIDLIELFGVLTILGVGLLELSADRITVGGLLAFLIYLSQFYGPVRGLGQFTNTAYAAAAGAERIVELLDQRPQVITPPDPIPLQDVRGDLSLRHVGFRYPATERDALQDVTLDMPAGSTTALVGPSGAGKTSLTKLLLRLHDPTSGEIYLDGHELRKLDPAALRRHIAVVLQETLLLDGTVAENILAGRPEAGPDELRAAACAADAHEFITALPDGYDTRVGQRGRLLSGGQRQRIAIARAMIRNAPVLILDEPTASLDAAAAQRILAPMRRLMSGRTTLVISHNLLTVTDADQIVLLERGHVAEIGTHEQLLAADRRYAQLFRLHRPAEKPSSTRPRPSPRPPPRPFPQPAAHSPHPSTHEATQ